MPIIDFQSIVEDLVRDDANQITNVQRDTAIVSAIERYSKDKPRTKVEDIAAPGGSLLPLPVGWQADFSSLATIEYPVGQVPPNLIPNNYWNMYQSPVGLTIQLYEALQSNVQCRLTFSIKHVLDDNQDTIPLGDREPVCCLAAASLCDQLAAFYSGSGDSTIKADSVEHQSASKEYAARAAALRKRYLNELGIDDKKNVAAAAVVSFDRGNSLGDQRLTHGRDYKAQRRRR